MLGLMHVEYKTTVIKKKINKINTEFTYSYSYYLGVCNKVNCITVGSHMHAVISHKHLT